MAEAIAGAAAWVGSWLGSAGASIFGGTSAGSFAAANVAYGVGYAVGYGVTYAALTAAVSYGVSELTRPDSGGIGANQGRELQLQVDPTFPRQLCIGRRLVAGSMSAHYSCGPNRERLHLVVPLVDHPVQSCARVFGDGRLVYDTPLLHGVRTEIPWDDRIGGLVYMTFWDGRPGQTADPNLVSESAIEPDVVAGRKPGWTTAHKGAGIAWVHIELGYNQNVMTSMPSFLFDIVGAGLYDRRLDSTAGGSGSHRLNDPSTWLDEWSDNPATALDHYLLGIKVEDDDLAFGVGLRADDVPYAAMAAAADLSDEDLVTGTGEGEETIKRYRANGVVSASDTFEDVIEALQLQMGARLVDYGGRIGLVPAEERTPVCELSDGDWVADDSVSFEDRRTFDDLVGAVEGRFADPSNVYQPTPYEAQLSPEAVFADGGEAATRTLELPFEVHPRRAARLARIWLERERRQARLSGTFTFAAWELEPGDWFSYSSTHEQLEEELFEVIDIVKNADFSVTLTAQAVDAGIVAFDNDNDPDLSEPVFLEPVSLWLDTPEFDVEATTLTASGTVEPALLFTLTSDDPLAREIVIERAQWNAGTSEFTGASIFSVHHTDEATTVLRTGILPSTAYKVRCKSRAGARESDWAEWSAAVTTGSTYTVPRAGTADAATSGSTLETELAALGSASADADSRLDAVEADLAAAVTALDADIAAAEARLDDAESDIALQGTAIGTLETVTDGQATLITALQATTTPNPNLMPYPSGTAVHGESAPATDLGWSIAGAAGSPSFIQTFSSPRGGSEYYIEWASGFSSAGYQQLYYDIPVSDGGAYTFALNGQDYNCAAYIQLQCLNAARDADTTTATTTADLPASIGRIACTSTGNSSTRWLRIYITIPPQTAVGYAALSFSMIKTERGSVATTFTDDASVAVAQARITEVETVAAANGSAIATLDSRLDTAETDISGVTSTASNLSSRMAAIDGGSASAQTLAQVKAELEGDIDDEAVARAAAVSSEASARADADTAAAGRLDALEATIDTPTTGLAARVTGAESAIVDLDSTKAEASALASLSATVTTQGTNLTAAEGDIDDLETAAAATASTLATHTADITEAASAIADAESAIAALDSRLDAAETDIDGVTGDVSTLNAANLISRMAAVDGGTASAQTLASVKAELEGDLAGEASARSAAVSSLESADATEASTRAAAVLALEAKTNPAQNLFPYPSGTGTAAAAVAASELGWAASGSHSNFYAGFYAPRGGQEYYIDWASGFDTTPSTYQLYYFDVPVADGGAYALSMNGGGYGCTAYIQLQCLNAARDADTTTASAVQTLTGTGRQVATATGNSSTRWLRCYVVLSPQVATALGYAAVSFRQIKLEAGSTATAYTEDALLAQTYAQVVEAAEAITTVEGAQAAFESSATASIGDLEASSSALGSAITTLEGAAAIFETVVAASGGDLAAVRLKAGTGGSFIELISTVLRLANISNGDVIEIMRATGGEAYFSRPISSDASGRRLTVGPGYGVSGEEVVLWFGPDTTAPSAQSRTNGYFSLGTDGKVYYGGGELATGVKFEATMSPTTVSASRSGAGYLATPNVTCNVTGGTAPYTFRWELAQNITGSGMAVIGVNDQTTAFDKTLAVAEVVASYWRCIVRDSSGRITFAEVYAGLEEST